MSLRRWILVYLATGPSFTRWAVLAFYGGGLLKYLFAEKQHTVLRRSITSLLSGDVFATNARWLNDTRTRLVEMGKNDWKPDAVLGT